MSNNHPIDDSVKNEMSKTDGCTTTNSIHQEAGNNEGFCPISLNKSDADVGGGKLLIPLDFHFDGIRNNEQRQVKIFELFSTTQIPVGNVGKDYFWQIDMTPILTDKGTVTIQKHMGTEDMRSLMDDVFGSIGLSVKYENMMLTIEGTPTVDYEGNIEIEFYFVFEGDSPSYEKYNITGGHIKKEIGPLLFKSPFLINPNPATLWNNLEPPADGPYWKKNEDSEFMQLSDSGKIVIAASQRGRSHAHEGKFRDDHFSMKADERTGWYYLAVADGAGSAPFSRQGSKMACEEMIKKTEVVFNESRNVQQLNEASNLLISNLETNKISSDEFIEKTEILKCFHSALHQTWMAIHKEASGAPTKRKIQDYHTTLLFAAIKSFEGRWLLITYWVGDGGLAVYRPNGKDEVLVLGTPDGGEFAGQTKFFTMNEEINEEPIKHRMRATVLNDFDALFMMTDGISDPFFPAESNISDYNYWHDFRKSIFLKEFPGVFDRDNSPQEKMDALLKGLNFYTKGNHDDRTMLIVMNQKDKNFVDRSDKRNEEMGYNNG